MVTEEKGSTLPGYHTLLSKGIKSDNPTYKYTIGSRAKIIPSIRGQTQYPWSIHARVLFWQWFFCWGLSRAFSVKKSISSVDVTDLSHGLCSIERVDPYDKRSIQIPHPRKDLWAYDSIFSELVITRPIYFFIFSHYIIKKRNKLTQRRSRPPASRFGTTAERSCEKWTKHSKPCIKSGSNDIFEKCDY